MLDKMYDAMDAGCKKARDVTGVPIKLPRPGKRALKISSVTNSLVGAGFILFGIISPYKWTIILGGLGVTGGLIINSKAKSLKK